jgi:hypothetical protein
MLAQTHEYVDTLNHLMAADEKARFDEHRAHPHFFAVGDKVMLYTPSDAIDRLASYWTAGHEITDISRAPDFYTVVRIELDGSRGPPADVPVDRLLPFDTSVSLDCGVSLQTKRGHFHVTAIVGHTDSDGFLSFTVRWADNSVSTANTADLFRHCTPMLRAYAEEQRLPWTRVAAAASEARR